MQGVCLWCFSHPEDDGQDAEEDGEGEGECVPALNRSTASGNGVVRRDENFTHVRVAVMLITSFQDDLIEQVT